MTFDELTCIIARNDAGTQIQSIQTSGGVFFEPTSVVGGVTVQMPWGFIRNSVHSIEFLMMRFARKGLYDLSVILKPIIPGLEISGSKKLIVKHVFSEKSDEMFGAKKLKLLKDLRLL